MKLQKFSQENYSKIYKQKIFCKKKKKKKNVQYKHKGNNTKTKSMKPKLLEILNMN